MSLHANFIVDSYASFGRIVAKNYEFGIGMETDGKISFAIPNVASATKDTTVLVVGKVYDVIITWDMSTVKYYINGVLSASDTSSIGNLGGTSINLTIGYDDYTDRYPYNGRISNVRIYSKTLSASEVLQHYNALKYRFTDKGTV